MIANYHSHTWRCGHAKDTEREYVEKAIAGGIKILGFSDHAPMPYPNGFISSVRMRMEQLDEYVDTVLALRDEYKEDIEIHLGMEAEYYPDLHDRFLDMIRDYPVEYLLLGQHYLGRDGEDPYVAYPTDDEVMLRLYTQRCMEAIETGSFTYVAHPDVFYFNGSDEIYEKWARELCQCAKGAGIPLEINFLGIEDHRHYPKNAFWKVAGEVGNDCVFGADAHTAANEWRPDAIAYAQNIVTQYGLHRVDTVKLIDPLKRQSVI